MTRKFAEHTNFSLSQVNKEILESWQENDLFHKSLELRKGKPTFVFFEGPPSANGHPGIHHVLARTIKDTVLRYKSMKGFYVPRKAGWDTHGLPVELSVEKELGITKDHIGKTISVEDYNGHCRADVMKYTREWRELSEKMGYWVDLDHPYITYENSYIETLWWLLKQLYNKGLLYKGYTIQPYSPAAGTGLSSHELNQPGCYRDVKDTTVTALFRLLEPKAEMTGWGTTFFAAWTTTPWTLPSNTALCVGPNIDYVCVRTYNAYTDEKITVVMAESRLNAYLNAEGAGKDLNEYKHGDKVIPYEIVGRYKGSDLVNMKYAQLMPWVKPCMKVDNNAPDFVKACAQAHPERVFQGENGKDSYIEMEAEAFRVIAGDYVTTDDGTGIVHIAPTFGADDAFVAKAAGIPSLYLINKKGETRPMVDLQGKYYLTEELDEAFQAHCVDKTAYSHHAGAYVKNAYDPQYNVNNVYDEKSASKAEDLNIVICMEMKQNGSAWKIEKHVHNYPHCWRTDKPVLYYPLDSWFIRSSACKQRMMELNETILWKPESTGTGRFGKWLENLNDWNLSRSRYWGTPLPIWRSESGEEVCIGSVEELYHEIEKSVEAGLMKSNPLKDKGFIPGDYSEENYHRIDLHRPYVDNIVLLSPTGKPMTRETDLIDVWFDSGAMPYAQLHYPFENRELIDEGGFYPADFIAEGVDQTRGWFFTLHAIACMVFDSVAFKAVISNGLVLAADGSKMSKRLGNAVDPFQTIDELGSDPVRWYMITNSSPWDNLRFDVKGVKDVVRTFFGKVYQTYSFFSMYANVDNFTNQEPSVPMSERPEIDRWMISDLNTLVKAVNERYEDYDLTKAGRLIEDFVINDLSNWYVRLNRKRFWGNGMSQDKLSAYQCLYTCLETVARLMAPLAPFYADRLYTDLVTVTGGPASVHLAEFPQADEALIDSELESRMMVAQKMTSMVLSLRKKHEIIVRQPLKCIMIPVRNQEEREQIETMKNLITSEVNVKDIRFVDAIALQKSIKCNFRVMGKKYGKLMSQVSQAVNAMTQEQIAALETVGSQELTLASGEQITLLRDEVDIISQDIPGWSVANEGLYTVALDLEITDDLKREGIAREIVKRIQGYRKDSGFEITDHIEIRMEDNVEIKEAVEQFREYICGQVLCDELVWVKEASNQFDLDGFILKADINQIKNK